MQKWRIVKITIQTRLTKDSGWIAECVETGNVATATLESVALEMLFEILKDETEYGNLDKFMRP